MKAKVNGAEVEGTPEEIAKILGITIKDTDTTVTTSASYDHIPETCKRCPNYGKGPCMCTVPYMTHDAFYYQVFC